MESLQEKRTCCQQTQLRNAISNFSNARIVNRIIATGVDVNHKFFINSSDKSQPSKFSTPLHLAATKINIANFQVLLDHGANVAIHDSEGLTALHRIVKDCLSDDTDEPPSSPFINSALLAHIKSNNPFNPGDNYGFTHFHVACMMNNVAVVKFFLNNGVNVNQAVCQSAPLFAGFTPLHFSAKFTSLETAEILVGNGASINMRDARGMTAIHVLIERKIAMLELIKVTDTAEALRKKFDSNESIIKLLLDSNITNDHLKDDIGMSKYHIICTLQQSALTEKLLEQSDDIHAHIKFDSNVWPGYTMLHFAAHCNVQTVKVLLAKGANIEAKDSSGVTPFDICIQWCKLEDLHSIVSMIPSWNNIYFTDGNTKLLNFIASMKSLNEFKLFLKNNVGDVNIRLPENSPLWPGLTLLHLSVIFAKDFIDKEKCAKSTATFRFASSAELNSLHIVKACLNFGVSVNSQDSHGRTALHLAFRSSKWRIVDILLLHHYHQDNNWNVADDENLSLLHIACAVKNIWAIEQWLANNSEVDVDVVYRGNTSLLNVEPEWTPLHAAIYSNADVQVATMLLDHGADPYLVDKKSFTPIHLLLVTPQISPNLSNLLLSMIDLKESTIGNPAFTHLHVASYFNNVKAIDRLLDLGADIDALSSLPRFENCTPLHLAMMNKSTAAVDILVRRGADVLAKGLNDWTLLSKALSSKKHGRSLETFIVALRANETLRQRAKMELGLTLLHVVCRAGHVDAIADLLSKGADVNDKIRDDSPFWPGWTPLHVLVTMGNEFVCQKKKQNYFKTMLEMLLEHGSQVTIMNADGDTPLHLMLKKNPGDTGYFIINSLLSYQKDFSINPINKDGVTHFHAACLANNLEATEKFIAHNESCVNQTIECSANHYGGSTPLHLALNTNSKRHIGLDNQLRMLDLLLKYNADVGAEDDHGYTPLHVAVDCDPSCVPLLQKLIEKGADINAQTINGQTAFEMILRSKEITINEIEFFVKKQYPINGCNQMTDKGYLSIILNERNVIQRNKILEALMSAPSIMVTDGMGRTAIHNIVSTDDLVICEHDYIDLIDKLAKLGCDVNEQDKYGMTALHLAMLFRNKDAIIALLISGIDINIVDYNGKTAFSYIFDPCTRCLARCNNVHDYILQVLANHVAKLQHFQLYVSETNEKLKHRALENSLVRMVDKTSRVRKNNKEPKSVVIGPRGWTLHDFLTENGAVKEYHRLTQADQTVIDHFFGQIDYYSFYDLKYVLKVQYRHAVVRGSLIQPAIASIKSLFGLPDLCAEAIVWYLRNPDMKNLIIAASSIHDYT